jgi:hypothetical protein
MGKLEAQLIKELQKFKPDKHYVRLIADAVYEGGVDFTQFVDSGRFMTRETFLEHEKESRLKDDTTDVVAYIGDFIIQVRKPDTFFIDGFESTVLDKVEAELWHKHAKKYIEKLHDK